MSKRLMPFALAALLLGSVLNRARADVIVLTQGGTYQHLGADLFQRNPTANNGADELLRVGRSPHGPPGGSGGDGVMRSVLAFDLTGIPASSTINSVTLDLTIIDGEGAPGSVELHRVAAIATMLEGTRTIATLPPADGVTWNEVRPGVPWATPGGDFLPAVLSSIPATPVGGGPLAVVFPSSPGFASAVEAALAGGEPLELLALSPSTELGGPRNMYRFASDDHPTADFRPRLTIDFTPTGTVVPEPGTLTLMSIGLVFLGFAVHRGLTKRCR